MLIIFIIYSQAQRILNQTSKRKTVINLNNDVSRIGFRIKIEIPVCSKYGATKSITSSRSAVIFKGAMTISVSYV